METTFDYLREHAAELGSRILETYPPLQSTKDPVAPRIATLLRKALPAQALAITGTAKYLRKAKAARIVAECGAGKTYMALGAIHVLAEGMPSTTLVMCPSHITQQVGAGKLWLTVPRARTFLIEDMRNGGDPKKPHGICEVSFAQGPILWRRGCACRSPSCGAWAERSGASAAPRQPSSSPVRTKGSYTGARLPTAAKIRAKPRGRHQSRHWRPRRIMDPSPGAPEAHPSRLHRQDQAL